MSVRPIDTSLSINRAPEMQTEQAKTVRQHEVRQDITANQTQVKTEQDLQRPLAPEEARGSHVNPDEEGSKEQNGSRRRKKGKEGTARPASDADLPAGMEHHQIDIKV